jgi:glycosyltransferase involved in cell wall biosynthesis
MTVRQYSAPPDDEQEGPLRILLVINRFTTLGGAEGSTVLIVDGLQSDAMRFGVVTLHGLDLVNQAALEARGVEFRESGPGFLSQLGTVVAAVREFRPDLIHATLFDAEVVACIAGVVCGVPVIRSVVNTPYGAEAAATARSPRRLALVRRLDGALARYGTFRLHAISAATRESAIRWLGADPDRIVVVPRGRDATALGENTPGRRSRVRHELSIGAEAPVFVNTARQDPQKGQILLLDAFARVVRDLPDAVLLIAGRDGPETPALHARVTALGLDDHVRVLGLRDDVADLLCAADLFVFPSLWEGLGGSVLEAMALGVPVVAFDVPAVAEVLDDAGVVVPMRDTDAFADAILALMAAPATRAALSRRSLDRFLHHYTNASYLAGMRELYERAAREGSAAFRDRLSSLRGRKRS